MFEKLFGCRFKNRSKPKMKFQKGDIVKFVENDHYYTEFLLGKVGKITRRIPSTNTYLVDIIDHEYNCAVHEYEIKLVKQYKSKLGKLL